MILFKDMLRVGSMELSAKHHQLSNTLTLDDSEQLALLCLNHYNNGDYAFDEDAKAQSQNHRTHKSYMMKSFRDLFEPDERRSATKYLKPLLAVFNELNPERMSELRTHNRNLTSENKKLHKKWNEEKKTLCGNCYVDIKAYKENLQKEWAERPHIKEKDEEIERTKVMFRKMRDSCFKLEGEITGYKEKISELLTQLRDAELLRLQKSESTESLGDSKYKQKYKSIKKENMKLKIKLAKLEGDITSSSSSSEEEEYHPSPLSFPT